MQTHPIRALSPEGFPGVEAVLSRMQSLGPCSPDLAERIAEIGEHVETANAKVTLQTEGDHVRRPRYLLAGWACRCRYLSDGRRMIFDIVLPGDGVGVCLRPKALAAATTVALTAVTLADAKGLINRETVAAEPELANLLHTVDERDEQRLLGALVRLGRMTALERFAHLLIELHDRLAAVGLAEGGSFPFPLTQEMLADVLGLSTVHVNRTLQELRHRNLVTVERGQARLHDREALAAFTE